MEKETKHLFLDIQIKKAIIVIRARGYETLVCKTKKKEIKKPKKKRRKRKEEEATYWYQFTTSLNHFRGL